MGAKGVGGFSRVPGWGLDRVGGGEKVGKRENVQGGARGECETRAMGYGGDVSGAGDEGVVDAQEQGAYMALGCSAVCLPLPCLALPCLALPRDWERSGSRMSHVLSGETGISHPLAPHTAVTRPANPTTHAAVDVAPAGQCNRWRAPRAHPRWCKGSQDGRREKWGRQAKSMQAHLFFRRPFMRRERLLLEHRAAVNVVDGQRLGIRVQLIALAQAQRARRRAEMLVLVIRVHGSGALVVHGRRLLRRLAASGSLLVRVAFDFVRGFGQLRHALERVLFGDGVEVTRHGLFFFFSFSLSRW